jgi:hypothetical protein
MGAFLWGNKYQPVQCRLLKRQDEQRNSYTKKKIAKRKAPAGAHQMN